MGRRRCADGACRVAECAKDRSARRGICRSSRRHIVGFGTLLREGRPRRRVPKFEAFDISPLLREREQPLREIRFVADAHHGSPARLLRMMGFDTLYANAFADDEIERMAATQGRIVHWQPMRALVEPCKLRDFDS